MKDKECAAYINTYKCPGKTCEDCMYRFPENELKASDELDVKVSTFTWVPGENDSEYIKILESALKDKHKLNNQMLAKVKELKQEKEDIRDKTIQMFLAALHRSYQQLLDNGECGTSCKSCMNELLKEFDDIAEQVRKEV